MRKFVLGLSILIALASSCGPPTEEDLYQPLDEEQQLIWDTQLECFADYCDVSVLENPQVRVTHDMEKYCAVPAAGCADYDNNGITVLDTAMFRNPGQYPDSVPGVYNTELFMHEFLHLITQYCFGNGSHENGWFGGDSPCPQDLWKKVWVKN